MLVRTSRPAAIAALAFALLACEEDLAGPATFQSCDLAEHAIGTTVSAHLMATDCLLVYRGLQYGEFVHYYAIELLVPRNLTIRMDSDDFDPKLIVWRRGTLQVVAEDDDGGPGLNARISRSFAAGQYVIGASSFAAGQAGAYTLSTE
jgi:hypothetical protein